MEKRPPANVGDLEGQRETRTCQGCLESALLVDTGCVDREVTQFGEEDC